MTTVRIKIYTNNYCINIAENLKNMIEGHYKISAMVVPKRFDKIDSDTLGVHEYVIIFQGLLSHQPLDHPPPSNKYFIYQLEQLNKPHIYMENVEPILDLIERSICTFDYSLTNLDYYPENVRHKIKHLIPPPCQAPVRSQGVVYDVLFYGLMTPRRGAILRYLSTNGYKVGAVEQVFGKRLHDLVRKTRIVLNLHNAPDAILEMPRLHEAVHTGARIISEYPCEEDWGNVSKSVKSRIHFIDFLNEDLSNISSLTDVLKASNIDKEQYSIVSSYLHATNNEIVDQLAPINYVRKITSSLSS